MAGPGEDYDAAQYRQERRVRAESWPRKRNTHKTARMCSCHPCNLFFCYCISITFCRKLFLYESKHLFLFSRWSFGILLYELITLGKAAYSVICKQILQTISICAFSDQLPLNVLISTICSIM